MPRRVSPGNNGYAISTPAHEQYRGDGIGSRAVGYGMDVIRVDGNDIFAVYNATVAARTSAIEHNRPVLIEAMTYRVSHHSTSDDASAYRPDAEVDIYKSDSAIQRFNLHITNKGIWDEEKEEQLRKELRAEILFEFDKADKVLKPTVDSMFDDVFEEIPLHLQQQKKEMRDHVSKYPGEYDESDRVKL